MLQAKKKSLYFLMENKGILPCEIWGSHGVNHESYYFLGGNMMSVIYQRFGGTTASIFGAEERAK
jgi:hypothetical protein